MTDGLTLQVLPAEQGDCLLLTCRAGAREHHLLIDAGVPATATLLAERLRECSVRRLELLVVSHIDTDHIGGMVRLLRDPGFDCEVADAWFNGYRHLPRSRSETGVRGLPDAERLTAALTGTAGGRELPWNALFGQRAVARADDDARTGDTTAPLPCVELPFGMRITLLSPTPKRLDALYKGWDGYLHGLRAELPSTSEQEAVSAAGTRGGSLEDLAARKTSNDRAPPNGSSIAFLAEYSGRSILFAADAFPTVLYPALLRLARERAGLPADADEADVPPLHVDVFKLPHHGSRANVAGPLFDVVRADHYVVSTSGKVFGHPDEEAMARVILRGRPLSGKRHTLWFNYVSGTTRRWLDESLKRRYDFATAGAETEGPRGATIALPARRTTA